MDTLETSLMKISVNAWANAAAALSALPDQDLGKLISEEFKSIQKLADDVLIQLRGGA